MILQKKYIAKVIIDKELIEGIRWATEFLIED